MARSKYIWLVVFEDGRVQFFSAQSLEQIIYHKALYSDVEDIISITRMDLADIFAGSGQDRAIVDIPFRD